MFGQNGIHEKNVQVGRMVRNNDVRPIRKGAIFHLFHVVKTSKTHDPAPQNEQLKTQFFPFRTNENCKKKGIKDYGENGKNHSNINFPKQTQRALYFLSHFLVVIG